MAKDEAAIEARPRGDFLRRTPFDRSVIGTKHADHLIIHVAIEIIWALSLISPSAWIFSFFKKRYADSRYHTIPGATDVLMMVWFGLSVLLSALSDFALSHRHSVALFCILLIVDLARSNIHLMVVRPAIDPGYRPFNKARSLLLSCVAYATTTLLFAALYDVIFRNEFSTQLDSWKSISLAVGIATTTGASGISPKYTAGFIVVSLQAILSVAYLGVVISTAISRQAPIDTIDC